MNEMLDTIDYVDFRITKEWQGQLSGSWHFRYDGKNYGRAIIGIQNIDTLMDDAKECFETLCQIAGVDGAKL